MRSNTTKALLYFLPLAFFASFGPAEDSSLNTTNTESSEATAIVAFEKLLSENRRLKAEIEDAKSNSANATQEAEIFKRQIKSLSERMEILGANATEPSKLEQRLLQAVHDLQASDKARRDIATESRRLSQSSTEYLKNPDQETRTVLQAELHKVAETLLKADAVDIAHLDEKSASLLPDLMNAKVSAVKPELACVVINIGHEQGVRIGAPFQVCRKDKVIGTIRVVDVRQVFAGSVIQNLVSDKDPIQLGDTIQMDARLN